MSDIPTAQRAIEMLNNQPLDAQLITVEYARPHAKPSIHHVSQTSPPPSSSLFVQGLTSDTQESDLLSLFSSVGKVQTVAIKNDPLTHKTHAMVIMSTQQEATAAISHLNTTPLRGSPISIQHYTKHNHITSLYDCYNSLSKEAAPSQP